MPERQSPGGQGAIRHVHKREAVVGRVAVEDEVRAEFQAVFNEKDVSQVQLHLPSNFHTMKHFMWQLLLLLFLYTLQGIPMGLSGSVPLLLVSAGRANYSELSLFTLVSLPFSMKLLWAPLVDSYYFPSVGRRKSWLLPVMFLVGLVMVGSGCSLFGYLVDGYMDTSNVVALSALFLVLYFLMATQDVAVDGWALTMLPSDQLHYASTTNSLGQNLGFFLAYGGLLALSDVDTSNRFFRSSPKEYPVATLGTFMTFWGILMLASTVLIASVPEEGQPAAEEPASIRETYSLLGRILRNRPCRDLVKLFALIRIPFASTEAALHLQIVEAGVPKESMAFMAPAVMALGIVSPVAVSAMSRRLGGSINTLKLGFLLRCAMVLPLIGCVLFVADKVKIHGRHELPVYVYAVLLMVTCVQNFVSDIMFVSQLAMFAEVSDPICGGTYMTFLNTIANIGAKWPNAAALWFLDRWPFDSLRSFALQSVLGLGVGLLLMPFYMRAMSNMKSYAPSAWLVGPGSTPSTPHKEIELKAE